MPLTATVDSAWTSVKLVVDLSGVTSPWFITVTRTNNATGEQVIVRSGDMVTSPGGTATVYDHEAPLGVSLTYSAQAYTYLGAATGSPTTATVTSAGVASPMTCWVKSLDDPSLSRAFTFASIGFLGRTRRIDRYQVLGRSNEVVHSRGLAGRAGPLSLVGLSWTQIDALENLLAKDRLLVQFDSSLHVDDMFAAAGDVVPKVSGPRGAQAQTWSVELVEADRPSTAGEPLRIPGVTWTTVAATWASWTAVAAARTSWNDVADG